MRIPLPPSRLPARSAGFTIIEVMIVLVIAAVIILILFLAVPALQRNSRNSQVNNAAARLSAAFLEYASTNGYPTGGTLGQNSDYATAVRDLSNTANEFTGVEITPTDASINSQPSNKRRAQFRRNRLCNEERNDIVSGLSVQNRFALVYWLEPTGSNPVPKCLQVN